MPVPDDNAKGSMLTPEAHVAKALILDHPFQTPPNLPLDFQYASLESAKRIQHSRFGRMKQAQRLEHLAERSEPFDKAILARLPEAVMVAAANARLGLLTVLTFILLLPDLQMTTI